MDYAAKAEASIDMESSDTEIFDDETIPPLNYEEDLKQSKEKLEDAYKARMVWHKW
ncbi:MAG: hypothetical protein M1812_008521, partial [Candelaria pacifica]